MWLAVDLRQGSRSAPAGRKRRAVRSACERWLGFFVSWAFVAQVVYLYAARTLAGASPPASAVLSVVLVAFLGVAAILALTVGPAFMSVPRGGHECG